MSEQVTRKDVDWKRANCLGLEPELFFKQQSELLADGLSYQTLRRVCFSCPIWKDCLRVASQYEGYGFWGGLSEEERKQIYDDKPARRWNGLTEDLKNFPNININEIITIVRSVDRPHGFARFYAKW